MSTPNSAQPSRDFTHACWRKSSYSGGANDCVELADLGSYIAIRDSKNPQQAPLVFKRSGVAGLVAALMGGGLGAL